MMRTIVLKLRIDEAQREALLRAMEAYTVAFNMAAEWGFRNRTYNRISTHFGTYRRIRVSFQASTHRWSKQPGIVPVRH